MHEFETEALTVLTGRTNVRPTRVCGRSLGAVARKCRSRLNERLNEMAQKDRPIDRSTNRRAGRLVVVALLRAWLGFCPVSQRHRLVQEWLSLRKQTVHAAFTRDCKALVSGTCLLYGDAATREERSQPIGSRRSSVSILVGKKQRCIESKSRIINPLAGTYFKLVSQFRRCDAQVKSSATSG
uniref:Uncharacterized protein n=1 Tax=Peronospora matthiolae TaxID=2874970 RepID=A0AAV1UGT2_9STRA